MKQCNCLAQYNTGISHGFKCPVRLSGEHRQKSDSDRDLDRLREILDANEESGVGNVTVHRLDGTKSEPFYNVRYDANRMENGFLTMETTNDEVYHVANCDYWTVDFD